RHGPTGAWSFAFADGHGTRFVTDQTGVYKQGVNYQPFGEASSPSGPVPMPVSVGAGSTYYTSEQFNGGDLLAAVGLVNLGARVYDPVIARFLSRDPIIQAKSPYAFADNDPINHTDPTGMQVDMPEADTQHKPSGTGTPPPFLVCGGFCGDSDTGSFL